MLYRFRDVLTFKLCVGRLGNVQSLNTLVFRFCCSHLIFCNMMAPFPPPPTPAEWVTQPWDVYMPHTADRAKTGHPTCHVNVIKIKKEIKWTGGLPLLGRLPHLHEVPHLYQNRPLVDIDMLFESIIRRNAASWCSIYLRTEFINISALKYGNYSRAAFILGWRLIE